MKQEWICLEFDALNANQLYDILQLREQVFQIEQNCLYVDIDDKDRKASHLMCYEDSRLVAYARIIPKWVSYPDSVSIGRVCTHINYRQLGWGKRLMQQAILQCRTQFGGESIQISAQSYLLRFYSELGFEAFGDEYLEDGIPHRAMILHDL